MAYVDYLNDATLRAQVKNVLDVGRERQVGVLENFQSNVIDPFSTLFESAVSGVDHDAWQKAEMVRQCQKTLSNHIGSLHQKILGAVAGWQDLGVGNEVDLVCHERKIIAEVKNKYNTVTGGKLADQYQQLDSLVMPKASRYKGYTAYFVNIIPKSPQRFDTIFTPSDKTKGARCQANELIRIIDGASFYALVTGREQALREMYDALPRVIESIFREDYGQPNFSLPDKNQFRHYYLAAYESR